MTRSRSIFAVFLAALLALAGAPAFPQPAPAPARAEAPAEARLPAARTTRHELALGDRTLAFEATAAALTLSAPDGREEADIAYVAYTLDGADKAARPVTFVVNGGPGAASAYLQIGAVGPWILPMAEPVVPSQAVALVPNPDTWLDFTDLVFVDPVGTGFSRLVAPDDRLRARYLSVAGDVDALADFIARWLTANGRTGSPKFFLGESYGGFRGPLVAEKLQDDAGVGLSGMTLVSPVLDFGWWQQPDYAPLPMAALLPSLAAARMEAAGDFSATGLAAAEAYAAGDFVTDLLRGSGDPDAVARLTDRVAALTGLDRAVVAGADGRIDAGEFAREIGRSARARVSLYDATVSGPRWPRAGDPVLDAMTAPLTSAMLGFYRDTLGWLPDRRYLLLNGDVNRAWSWGEGRGQPEAMTALGSALALDGKLEVLVAHGRTDLVTPYFGSTLVLRQLTVPGAADRVRQATYPGGHMFYTRPDSRRQFHDDAKALYGERTG